MRAGTIEAVDAEPMLIGREGKVSFTSAHKELCTFGSLHPITTPARDGADPRGRFQSRIREAFAQAQRSGQDNPIVIGAIPFDLNEPSCLYVPERYAWRDSAGPDPATGSITAIAAPIEQRNLPEAFDFKKAVEQAIVNFRLSDIRKAVLSVIRELYFDGPIEVERVFGNLRQQNPNGYPFRVPLNEGGELIGVSPELLIRKKGSQIVSNPLAGSAKRQTNSQSDQAIAQRLQNSSKDQYEHRLVIDEIRRLLAPCCSQLDIPPQPSLIHTPALWHLSTRIEGQLQDAQMNALQLACLLHPTPAVCGFPTHRARKLIGLVEPFERDLFAGMVGWCDARGDGEWVVAIRCGTVRRDVVRLFAGAGIVEASQPEAEWAEVQAKLATMLNAFGLKAETPSAAIHRESV